MKWTTTAFNRLLLRLGNNRSKILNYWFDIGLYVTLFSIPFAVTLLITANYQLLTRENTKEPLVIEPLVPGYNLPLSEIGYYSVTLLICSVIHEFGHALAAVKEDVHIVEIGVTVFLFVPVAYVNISTERLAQLAQNRVLRIVCAGVWHNIVLVVVAGLFYLSMYVLVSPLYVTGYGVVVTDMMLQSPLAGAKGLHVGDVVSKINDCGVTDENSWQECLSRARTVKPGNFYKRINIKPIRFVTIIIIITIIVNDSNNRNNCNVATIVTTVTS